VKSYAKRLLGVLAMCAILEGALAMPGCVRPCRADTLTDVLTGGIGAIIAALTGKTIDLIFNNPPNLVVNNPQNVQVYKLAAPSATPTQVFPPVPTPTP